MSRNTVLAIVVALVLIIAGWLLIRPKQSTNPSPAAQPIESPVSTESATPASATDSAKMEGKNFVTISSSAFSPQNITIKAGDTVTWMNTDTVVHTVNSNTHPTHTLYPILNKVGAIKAGEKKSLQFTAAGTYKFHDHLNPSLTGSITVQ